MSAVKLAEMELVGVVAYFTGPVWGGGPEQLLAQDELYRVLGIEALEAKIRETNPRVSDLADELVDYELSPPAVALLRQVLTAPGQARGQAIGSLAALRRLGG